MNRADGLEGRAIQPTTPPSRRGVRRSAAQRGASALAVAMAAGLIFIGAACAAVHVAVEAALTHATTAADAVAHDVVSHLAADPARFDLAGRLQTGASCAFSDGSEPGLPRGTEADVAPSCAAALASAATVAVANNSALVSIQIGPDPRAFRDGPVAPLFEALVEVRVPGPLAGSVPACRDLQAREGLCWVTEWSGAREAG